MTRRYQPYYCEENAWWLCRELADRERYAVVISNRIKQVCLFQQRAAPPGEVVVWDYHVIVVATDPAEAWDLDTRLGMPLPLGRYLDDTLPAWLPDLEVRFRVVPSDVLFATLTSDRSHMRGPDGSWLQPPPPWDPPTAAGHPMNLMRFIDMTDGIAGDVMDLDGLRQRFGV